MAWTRFDVDVDDDSQSSLSKSASISSLTPYRQYIHTKLPHGSLFHDLLRPAIFHHSVCSVITARNVTPISVTMKRVSRLFITHTHTSQAEHTADRRHEITRFNTVWSLLMPRSTCMIHFRPWWNAYIIVKCLPIADQAKKRRHSVLRLVTLEVLIRSARNLAQVIVISFLTVHRNLCESALENKVSPSSEWP